MYSICFDETCLVEREVPNVMDINRLIAEIHKRPLLWDIRSGERKPRYNVPDLWNEVASKVGSDVTVEQCKRKWKNLRDAYRAEVRRAERRIERDRLTGEYDPNANYSSKWVYFVPMSFINDTKRNRNNVEYENTNSNSNDIDNDNDHELYDEYDPHYQNMVDFKSEPEQSTRDGSNYGMDTFEDRDNDPEEVANDMLFKEFQNIATPLTARRLSDTLSLVNSLEHKIQHKENDPLDIKSTKVQDCNCAKRTDEQVHFLEDLEKEEQKLIVSTRKDITRSNKLDHVGDSDYNFLVSFLPQMKKMQQLENLQFRAKMCELVLNTLAPSIAANKSPAPSTVNSGNTTPTITCQQPKSSRYNAQETEGYNTATSTTSNN